METDKKSNISTERRKKILFFITHCTLSYEHAKMTIGSIGRSKNPMKFDKMYIYNTHPDELPNDKLLELAHKYDLQSFISEIELFPSTYPLLKTLASDIIAITNFCTEQKYNNHDAVYLLKSDCVISINLLNEMSKVDTLESFVLTPPYICAKKRVTDNEIITYCSKDNVVLSDNETFFNEDAYGTPETDWKNRPGVHPTDPNIKYISCTVKRDFTSHYLTYDNLLKIAKREQSWGGCWLANVMDKWIGTSAGFVVHKYHDIVSKSRSTPREGSIEEFLLS